MRIEGYQLRAAGSVILRPNERAHLEFGGLSVGLRIAADGGEMRTSFDPQTGDVLLMNFHDASMGAFSKATLHFPSFGDFETRFVVHAIGSPPAAYSIGYTVLSSGS